MDSPSDAQPTETGGERPLHSVPDVPPLAPGVAVHVALRRPHPQGHSADILSINLSNQHIPHQFEHASARARERRRGRAAPPCSLTARRGPRGEAACSHGNDIDAHRAMGPRAARLEPLARDDGLGQPVGRDGDSGRRRGRCRGRLCKRAWRRLLRPSFDDAQWEEVFCARFSRLAGLGPMSAPRSRKLLDSLRTRPESSAIQGPLQRFHNERAHGQVAP